MSYVCVLDFETTGLSADRDRAIEVGVVRINLEDRQIVDQYQSLMNSRVPIPQKIVNITGITNAMVNTAPASSEVMRRVHSFIGNSHVVAHNASFDEGFFRNEMEAAGLNSNARFSCTLKLAKKIFSLRRNRLKDVAAHVGVVFQGTAHRALADAIVTAKVFLHMHRIAEERYARFLDTPDDVLEFLQEDSRPVLNGEFSRRLIEGVIKKTHFLRFDYINTNHEVTIGRHVRPLSLELRGNLHYLVAYCLLRNEERTFKVRNMTNVCEMQLTEVN